MRSSHTLDRIDTTFDDDRLVPDAGLVLPATLAHHLGLKGLVDEHRHDPDRRSRRGRLRIGRDAMATAASHGQPARVLRARHRD